MLSRGEVLQRLEERRSELATDFHVESLFLVGSVAREDAGPGSDVDLLVEFSRPVGLFHFIRLRRFLEQALDASVDLTTEDALPEPIRASLLEDAIRAA